MANSSDIASIPISKPKHPYNDGAAEVYCESTGISSLCLGDFFNDVLPFPDMLTGGCPCQNVAAANLGCMDSIKGAKSSLVYEQLIIIEALAVPFVIVENAEALYRRRLTDILFELNRMGDIYEWETS